MKNNLSVKIGSVKQKGLRTPSIVASVILFFSVTVMFIYGMMQMGLLNFALFAMDWGTAEIFAFRVVFVACLVLLFFSFYLRRSYSAIRITNESVTLISRLILLNQTFELIDIVETKLLSDGKLLIATQDQYMLVESDEKVLLLNRVEELIANLQPEN
jgi:hypothetical protein